VGLIGLGKFPKISVFPYKSA